MKREDRPSSEVLASIGLAAAGALAGVVARAVVIGGKLVAAGLETLERVLMTADEERPRTAGTGTVTRLRQEGGGPDAAAAPWADGVDTLPSEPAFEPAFEPADGLTSPARPARRTPRRSAAGAATRTATPRPAQRATGRSIPPPLRPIRNGPPVDDDAPAHEEDSATVARKAARTKAASATKTAQAATKDTTPAKAATKNTTPAKKTANKTTAGDAAAVPKKGASARRRTAAKKTAESSPANETRPEPTPSEPTTEPTPEDAGARHDDVRSVP